MRGDCVALALGEWGDVAQCVLAVTGIVALAFAYLEIRSSRAAARRQKVFDYADAFNQPEMLRASAKLSENWSKWTLETFNGLSSENQIQEMRVPNLIEDVAFLYNCDELDKTLAAEMLGVYAEKAWKASERFVKELRTDLRNPRLFVQWEQMQTETWRRRGAPGPLGKVEPGQAFQPWRDVRWYLSADHRQRLRSAYRKQLREAMDAQPASDPN